MFILLQLSYRTGLLFFTFVTEMAPR